MEFLSRTTKYGNELIFQGLVVFIDTTFSMSKMEMIDKVNKKTLEFVRKEINEI